MFRDELGNASLARNAGLRLDLRDFAPPGLPHPQGLARDSTDSLLIDSVTLCLFLHEAEKEEREANQRKGFVKPLRPDAKKRIRAETPPQELHSADERKFKDHERRIRARVSR